MKKIRIGVTGGMGSGKSEVSRFLEREYGFAYLDADQAVRQITSTDTEARGKILEKFNLSSIDDLRTYLLGIERETDFSNAISFLEDVYHPSVMKFQTDWASTTEVQNAPGWVYEASLLLSGVKKLDTYDAVFLVNAPIAVREQRVFRRMVENGLKLTELDKRFVGRLLLRQGNYTEIVSRSALKDRIFTISNSGSVEGLHSAVRAQVNSLTIEI